MKEWDYKKNTIAPKEVTAHSGQNAWWICPNGHGYDMPINRRTGAQNSGCPYCSGKRVLAGYNDLATKSPANVLDWDYKKNTILPSEVTVSSNKRVHWKCHVCGYEWEARVGTKINGSDKYNGCPCCSHKTIVPQKK